MRQEVSAQAAKASVAVAGTGTAWGLHDINQVISIMVGTATLIYIIVQLAYLVRKWWVQEAEHRRARKAQFGKLGD